MTSQTTRRLLTLSEEIAETRARLAMLRDRLAQQGIALEDSRLRMLIAETALADRDLHLAAGDYLRVRRQVERLEEALADLLAEQQRLLSATGTHP